VGQWEEGFRRLLDHVGQEGHARVPQSHTLDGYKLGWWVTRQRVVYAKGILDAERERRLGELPGWTWNSNDRRGTRRSYE
jgi:hypothetical protein